LRSGATSAERVHERHRRGALPVLQVIGVDRVDRGLGAIAAVAACMTASGRASAPCTHCRRNSRTLAPSNAAVSRADPRVLERSTRGTEVQDTANLAILRLPGSTVNRRQTLRWDP
jgi:hypothetical protein